MPTSNPHTCSEVYSTYGVQYRKSVVKESHWWIHHEGEMMENIRAHESLSLGLVLVQGPRASGFSREMS